MYLADEMVPKRENGQAANRRLTRSIHNVGYHHTCIPINAHSTCPCRCNTQVNVWFIRMYER